MSQKHPSVKEIPFPGAPVSKLSSRREGPFHKASRTRLYVLDFGKASLRSFERPEDAIQQLITAVTCNDPYFPYPTVTSEGCRQLWDVFRATYLHSAHIVSKNLRQRYGKCARTWPIWFINQWEKKAEELSQWEDGDLIGFGG
ncbi:hypothetical protein AA0119_g6201 [Alternaria tenuissima]|jgi:hypothetical protein|uniref:DUF3669 domain-containing protein n=1 Tax=Alternaria tenuissima TaxID=119927 RepID=A0A4Q4PGP7_9PLEO|nr:hypothetical protein B0T12DRAFT_485383 [Alternaria alternata]RYN41051.1 hypothetical protein AA0114_g10910 [Alternaria tenuissima]RYN79369.1 hypothetical protein AA0120_g10663 [Alternaria tenuissima]RYO00111.1 hypothetical protein AA0119_g6201 [Alternaria tenuissima]RYO11009.1 hypothetical protein AA0121_g10265 [Alternaria tenuissima]